MSMDFNHDSSVDDKMFGAVNEILTNLKLNTVYISRTEINGTKEDQRMQVNQVTYAILIGVLTVADMILIWTLGYIIIHYEKHGKELMRRAKLLLKNPLVTEGIRAKRPQSKSPINYKR